MSVRKALLALALGALAPALPAAPLMNGPALLTPQQLAALAAQLSGQRTLLGLDQDHGVRIASQHPGEVGTQIVRAHHTYKGVRVFGSETVVVSTAAGKILSQSVADRRALLGRGKPDALGAPAAPLSVKPAITAARAIAYAIASRAQGALPVAPPTAELIVFPVMDSERVAGAAGKREEELNALDVADVVRAYELAYLVRTRMQRGAQPVFHDSIVSAADGHIIAQWSMVQTALGSGHSQYNGVVPLSTTRTGGRYRMIDPLRGKGGRFGAMAVTNADHGSDAGQVYTHTANRWGDGRQYIDGGSTTNANGQTAAVNAMWGLMTTYDLHRNALGWHALDGQNSASHIAVHVNSGYDNAYYSDACKCMFIGDGSYFNSLGSIDVVAHEMGHGITASTSALVYAGESGGLNESSSDIAGEVVEAYARAGAKGSRIPLQGNDWGLGTEISKHGAPLRWMARPSRDGHSADAWSTGLKKLDVHYSSGPNNRMFYFLAQGSSQDPGADDYSKYLTAQPLAMRGIGLEKAYRIWFKAATTKFTSTTNYREAREKMVAAAQELYGVASAEALAVQRAYAAINVGADVDAAPVPAAAH